MLEKEGRTANVNETFFGCGERELPFGKDNDETKIEVKVGNCVLWAPMDSCALSIWVYQT